MRKIKMDCFIDGCDATFCCTFDYHKEQKEVRYYADGSGEPGWPAYVEITGCKVGGEDILSVLSDGVIESLQQYAIQNYEPEFMEFNNGELRCE